MIDFQDFGIEDNARYSEYLKFCLQVPSNGSPLIALGYKKKLKLLRGYAANLCWHKFFIGDNEFWAAPVGDWDEINWRKVFPEYVPADTTFFAVPEYLVNIWRRELGDDISVEEQRDNWDYILHLDRLKNLEGKKFKSTRNAINAFEKNYNCTIEEITPKIFDELKAFQAGAEENLQERVDNLVEAEEDDDIFNFALNHWDELKNLFGFVVRVDGQIVAYVIDERIDEVTLISPFAKADYNFKGVNQFAYRYDAKINLERGFFTENIMDDVGEENLRSFKEHLYPLVMLKKFIVTYEPSDAEVLLVTETREECGLKISFERLEKSLTISLSGKFNTDAANQSRENILTALDGAEKVLFDLNGLEYISADGFRILVVAFKQVKAQGGSMTIKNVGGQVREVLDMTGFAQIFNLED
ncbi:MAG: anti-sigma factor antagonist [Selenomonadaceae bacterium]|nr:anti-sigma factor antagonist [Selenomonadaceae bacterium]